MIRVQVFNTHHRHRINSREILLFARRVLRGEHKTEAEIRIIFISDSHMLELNGQYLNHWYATDVLSFPLSERGTTIEGEIYVNLDQARRQSRKYRVTIKQEVARLVAHGVLHLVGYNDHTAAGRKRMREREDAYLAG
jgi:probable rRNA maturation factor